MRIVKQLLTENDDLYDLCDDSNSILDFECVVTTVINCCVGHSQLGELASALDLHTICYLYLVVRKIPGGDRRRPADDWKVQFQRLTRQNIDNFLGNAGQIYFGHH